MKIRTKTEQIGLKSMSESSMGKVDVVFDRQHIDQSKLAKLGKYFGSKSPKAIAEAALSYLAGALTKPEADLNELSNYDKLGLLRELQHENHAHSANGNASMVKARVPLWQIMIIASNSENALSSSENLIVYSLSEVLMRLSPVFDDRELVS